MRLISIALAVFLAVASGESHHQQWVKFKNTHGKLYSSHIEDSRRFSIFQSNLRKIEEHNAKYDNGETSYFLGINQFADQTQQEFSAWLKHSHGIGTANIKSIGTFEAPLDATVPDSLDWRSENAVTAVKNQTTCTGGSWAFAAIAATEGAYAIKYKELVSFSEQQLLDCTSDYGLFHCWSGLETDGVQYVADYGVEKESDYPFKGVLGNCSYDSSKVVTKVKGVIAVTAYDANALKAAVATHGPCTVQINANNVQFYSGGIYEDSSCTNCPYCLNQSLTIVGYGTENGVDYWIIKNSWGPNYGEQGYLRLKRGVNQCGVEVYPHCAIY